MTLPPDSHVHSEWSWDAPFGSMVQACARAVALGLPSVAFTEHVDSARTLAAGTQVPDWQRGLVEGRLLSPPEFDAHGYEECLAACRERFDTLKILSGVELGEPHVHPGRSTAVLGRGRFDRVLASAHTLPVPGGGRTTVDAAYQTAPPDQVLRTYLGEVAAMLERFDDFDVLAHIDYAARYWPRIAGALPVADFAKDYRPVLALLSTKGKALEVNTRVPLAVEILRWWHDVGGQAITFASDAHRPEGVARGFTDAVELAAAAGFGAGRAPHDLWTRR